jgi:hypothetical protein
VRSDAVQDLQSAFDHLTVDEQREAVPETLRRAGALEHPPLDDEAIAQIADLSFEEYDAREAAQDEGWPRRGLAR